MLVGCVASKREQIAHSGKLWVEVHDLKLLVADPSVDYGKYAENSIGDGKQLTV
jgi:hypothetical protein